MSRNKEQVRTQFEQFLLSFAILVLPIVAFGQISSFQIGTGFGLILLTLILFFQRSNKSTTGKVPAQRGYRFIIFLTLLSSAMALLGSFIAFGDTDRATSWIILVSISGALGYFLSLESKRNAIGIVRGVQWLATVNSILVIWNWIALDGFAFSQKTVLFEYYLQDAIAISIGCFISLAAVFAGETRLRLTLPWWTQVFITSGALFILASRQAILFAVIGLAVSYGFSYRWREINKRRHALFLVILGLVVGVLIFSESIRNNLTSRFQSQGDIEQINILRRSIFQTVALDTLYQYPFGLGWDAFSSVTAQEIGLSVRSAHSTWLAMGLNIGVLGTVLIFATSIFLVWKAVILNLSFAARALGLVVPLLLLVSWFDDLFVSISLSVFLVFCFFAGLGYIRNQIYENSNNTIN